MKTKYKNNTTPIKECFVKLEDLIHKYQHSNNNEEFEDELRYVVDKINHKYKNIYFAIGGRF